MTREELKEHCEKQIKGCEMWAKHNGEEPSGKVYEEHKLILELLEQEPFFNKPCVSEKTCEHDKNVVLDKIRAEIESYKLSEDELSDMDEDSVKWGMKIAYDVVNKYKTETEG